MGLSKKFFNKTEQEFIQAILYHVAEHVDFDVESALSLFHINTMTSLNYSNGLIKEEYDITKKLIMCKLLLKNNEQCLKLAKVNGMCTTHNKQNDVVSFPLERIVNNSKKSNFQRILKTMSEIRKEPLLIDTKLVYINNNEYLIDPLTGNLFDFDNLKFIGKLNKFRQIKLYHKILL